MHASNLIVSRYSGKSPSGPGRERELDIAYVARDFLDLHQKTLRRYLDLKQTQEPDRYGSSEDDKSDTEEDILNIDNLESFFVDGEPFRRLKWNLRALLIPDRFLLRVKASAGQLYRLLSWRDLEVIRTYFNAKKHNTSS